MAKKPSYLREEALQPTRRKVGLTRNVSEALRDKETDKDPQGGEGASETGWDHLSPSYGSSIHLASSPPDSHSIIGLARGTT